MALTGMLYHWSAAFDWADTTIEINFAPTYTVAQTALTSCSGGGLHGMGITQFRVEGQADPVVFNWDPHFFFPASVWHQRMTGVTAVIYVGKDQQAEGTLNAWFF
ncbi:MAG: hypothetical protein ICV66_03640 [Chitinophagaceae bacterium]|nr:hypothetical protein [Chitinophagaceae bacterium]